MKVEIGAEAALFPEKEYINGIAVAVQRDAWRVREAAQHGVLKLMRYQREEISSL